MNIYLPIVTYAREIFEESSDEEPDVIEKVDNFAEVSVPNMIHKQFQRHFRMELSTFENLILQTRRVYNQINLNISRIGFPRMNIEKELLVTIWFLSNVESFRSVADRFGISKSTCWSVLYRTCKLLLKAYKECHIIKWPNRVQQNKISQSFRSEVFTGVIGCIDGSYIKINGPKESRNSYINRKGYHSLLLQGVCDSRKLFIDVYAGEAGSIHDYTLYKRSSLYSSIQNGDVIFYNDNYLLGDLAYKLDINLLVGFKDNDHLTQVQKRFNVTLNKIRVVIQNTFALLKGRFRILKCMETTRLDLTTLLIVTACVLHNICILNHDDHHELFNVDDEIQEEFINQPNNVVDFVEEDILAIEKRNNVLNRLHVNAIN